jgi:hypothetical protein
MSILLPSVDVAASSGDDNPNALRTEISAVTHSSAVDDVAVVDVNGIISGLMEAIASLENTAQSVTFLGDMTEPGTSGKMSRPSSTGRLTKAPPPAISVGSGVGESSDAAAAATTGASWFVDAILSNGLKDQEIRSALVLIRKAVEALSTAARVNGGSQQQLVAPTFGGSGGKLGVPSAHSVSAAGSARGMTRFDYVPALAAGLSPSAPSRSASVRGAADSATGSFLGSTTRTRQSQQRAFADVDDTDVAQWLNENYSQAPKRSTNGFEVQLDGGIEISMNTNLEPSDSYEDDSAAPPTRHDTDGLHVVSKNADVVAVEVTQATAEVPVVQKQENQPPSARAAAAPPLVKDSVGTPAKKQGSVSAPDGGATKYTRSTQRSFPAASSHKRTLELLELMDCPYMFDVDSPEFDVFAAHETHGSNLLVYVAANIFSRYNFVRSLQLDVPTLRIFFETVRLFYRDVNPYHNTIHASDVLQSTHVYLCVGNVKENFSDVELFAVLFAALVHDVGHLGIANAFLIKIRHPLARLYNDISPLENSHAALAFALLERPECNFFTSSTTFNRRLFDDFRSLVIEALHGTDMRLHSDQTKSVEGILEDGVIEDHEVGKLLKAILHAADLSNPMKPLPIYLKWVDRVMAEFWQQGDEEKRREMPISILCDRNGTNVAKSQMGFIAFVVKPFVKELAPVLPKVWLERLDSNWAALQQLTPEVEAERVAQISVFASKQWVDVDESVHPSCVQVLCGEVCSSASDVKLLQPSEFVASNDANIKLAEEAAAADVAAERDRWSMVAHRESVAATDTIDDENPREGSFESMTVPAGGDSSLSEGDLVNVQRRNPSMSSDVARARLNLPQTGKKEPRAHLGHHQGSSRLMNVDVDADSMLFHIEATRRLTSLSSETFAAASSNPSVVAEAHAQRWLSLLCELERERLQLREQLIERCRRGERRPVVLLVGNGSLRDDATDVSKFSLFSCAPEIALDALLHVLHHQSHQGKPSVSSDEGSPLHISTSYCGPVAKRIQLAELLKGMSIESIQSVTINQHTVPHATLHAALSVLTMFQSVVDPTAADAVASPMSTMSGSGGFNTRRKRVLSLVADASVSLDDDANRNDQKPANEAKTPIVTASDRNADIFSSLGVLASVMTQLLVLQWNGDAPPHNKLASKGGAQLPPITHPPHSTTALLHKRNKLLSSSTAGTYLTRTALKGWDHTATTTRSSSALEFSSVSEPTNGTSGHHKAVELYAMRTRTLPRSFNDAGSDDGDAGSFRRGLPSVWMRELKSRSPDNATLGNM